jgi:aspartyl-tRNA(Asn)/glutamyl-tRNA(Gln) amidotransferase subunit B
MQEGSLRCDANINLHIPDPTGGFAATPIVEVKNLNSFRGVERAMKYEAQRQYEEFRRTGQKLGDVPKATAGWDDERGVTVIQRRKEEASDYRYFPDPDLVPVTVDAARLEQVRPSLGELPAAQRRRLHEQYGLSLYDAEVLSRQGRAFVAYFEDTARLSGDAKAASNWLSNQVLATLNERKIAIGQFPISSAALADLLNEAQATGLNMQRAREVYSSMLTDGLSAKAAMDKLGFKVVADAGQLTDIVRRAMAANPKAVADLKKGKLKAADAIKGAVMRDTKGMAKTELVQQILMDELAKEG